MIVLFLIVTHIGIPSAAEVILTFRQEGKNFEEAYRGLKDELRGDFDVEEHIVDKRCSVEEFAGVIRLYKPKLVILMDNPVIALFRKYQAALPDGERAIPSITIMGVMIQDAITDVQNGCGISYEIPIVTSAVSLRSVLKRPIKKIGVIHREIFTGFLEENREFCGKEGMEIIGAVLPDRSDSYGARIKEALMEFSRRGIDALWVPNDKFLLQPDIIRDVWKRVVSKYKIPVIVGVEVLVNPELNFGTFAVIPDHVSLGSQAAGMVYDIKDNGWKCDGHQVDPPLSVYKILNLPQAKKIFKISEENLKGIDRKLK